MAEAVKTSLRVPPTCVQNAILCVQIIPIIPIRPIYVAIGNPLKVWSVFCLTSSGYIWKYVRAADDVEHAENLQNNCCRWISHLYKF